MGELHWDLFASILPHVCMRGPPVAWLCFQCRFAGFGSQTCDSPDPKWSQHLRDFKHASPGLLQMLGNLVFRRRKTVAMTDILGLLSKGGLTYHSNLQVSGDLRIEDGGPTNSCIGFCEVKCAKVLRCSDPSRRLHRSGASVILDQAFQVALGLCLWRWLETVICKRIVVVAISFKLFWRPPCCFKDDGTCTNVQLLCKVYNVNLSPMRGDISERLPSDLASAGALPTMLETLEIFKEGYLRNEEKLDLIVEAKPHFGSAICASFALFAPDGSMVAQAQNVWGKLLYSGAQPLHELLWQIAPSCLPPHQDVAERPDLIAFISHQETSPIKCLLEKGQLPGLRRSNIIGPEWQGKTCAESLADLQGPCTLLYEWTQGLNLQDLEGLTRQSLQELDRKLAQRVRRFREMAPQQWAECLMNRFDNGPIRWKNQLVKWRCKGLSN